MKKLLNALLLLTVMSCQEELATKTSTSDTSTAYKSEEFTPVQHSYVKSDTLRFANDTQRMVVVGMQQAVMYKDSTKHMPMDVSYYLQGKQIAAYSDSVLTEGEEELYTSFEGADNNEVSCEHFFTVNYGYGACGYTQQHFTFYVSPTQCLFVTKHQSSADGMYGFGRRFYNMCLGQSTTQITSVEESHEPDEKEEVVNVTYSDSTVYRFDGKVWNSKLVTEKDKVYRKDQEKM